MSAQFPAQPGPILSPDGMYQWDGVAWQPLQPTGAPVGYAAHPALVGLLAADVTGGVLPGVCVMTGEPTEGRLSKTFSSLEPWAYVGLLFGLIGIFVTILLGQKRIKGSIPLNTTALARCSRRRKVARWCLIAMGVSWLVFILCLVTNNAGPSSPLEGVAVLTFLFGMLLLLVGLIILILAESAHGVKWTVTDDTYIGRMLMLKNAHPNFIAALNMWHAQRVAAAGYGPPPAMPSQPA